MIDKDESTCPVCKTPLSDVGRLTSGDWKQFNCPNCGGYELTGTDVQMVRNGVNESPEFGPCLAHKIRRMQRNKEWPRVPSDLIDRMRKDEQERNLPDPAEQADNMVLWVGDTQRHSGTLIPLNYNNSRAVVGAFDDRGVLFISEALREQGLAKVDTASDEGTIRLTFAGWQRYHQLKRLSTSGPRAFMAMPFGNEILNDLFRNHFKPAVALTGFDLQRLDEEPKAGFINNRLLVEIRRARFLVADLTDWNAGAYWEAGFAEGLGKPVIYTCEREIFKTKGTHFDTNHHQTVLWDAAEPAKAVEDLKATIRATLPDEARMED